MRGIVNQLALPVTAMGAKDADQAALDDIKARGAEASRPPALCFRPRLRQGCPAARDRCLP